MIIFIHFLCNFYCGIGAASKVWKSEQAQVAATRVAEDDEAGVINYHLHFFHRYEIAQLKFAIEIWYQMSWNFLVTIWFRRFVDQ